MLIDEEQEPLGELEVEEKNLLNFLTSTGLKVWKKLCGCTKKLKS